MSKRTGTGEAEARQEDAQQLHSPTLKMLARLVLVRFSAPSLKASRHDLTPDVTVSGVRISIATLPAGSEESTAMNVCGSVQ